jgi:hypothetical protein
VTGQDDDTLPPSAEVVRNVSCLGVKVNGTKEVESSAGVLRI